VFGSGNPIAKTLILLGSPSAGTDEAGRVGQGEVGVLLDKMIGAIGLHRDDAWLTHVCLCHGGGTRPDLADTRACSSWLSRQWEVVQPKSLLSFGEVPAQFLLRQNRPLAQLRGKWFEIRGVPTLCTWSPEELLAEPARKREAWDDLKSFMNHLGLRR
jgi:DNA polymerase